ncbi:hypothetical protein KVV02_002749 [Mortierella alpina]|uniref:RING-type domain-containing protein n=1 Tax=Mortierella alpina TaxID=64518 RepID=A0A9P8CVY8_MORAP|nr:hypothetical protein KVV02_002749 [Mortierella alpina]
MGLHESKGKKKACWLCRWHCILGIMENRLLTSKRLAAVDLLVDRANLPAELICSLCAHILLQPYQVFCSQDHVFCQACLDSYVEDCIADRPSATEETEPVTVACPECSRMQVQPERLRVSAFRPAKFVQDHKRTDYPLSYNDGKVMSVDWAHGGRGVASRHEDKSIDTTHSADLDASHIGQLPSPSKGPLSPPWSSAILDSLHSHVDQAHNPVQAQRLSLEPEYSQAAQIAIDEFDQDEFSGLLEEMDMTDTTDLTILHGPTLLPVCFQGLESDQELVHDQDQGPTQELEATFSELQPGQATVPPTPYPRRRRRIIEEDPSQTTSGEVSISDGPKTTTELNQDINICSPTAVDRRVLQIQASWPWEVHRRPRPSLSDPDESSPIVTIADISTVASPVSFRSLSPSSPTSQFAGFASIARHTTAGPSHSAESHAFLPLHTHEPRYLRSRRRKVLRGRTHSGSPLPSVHATYERSRGKLWTEPITPDITSPDDLVQ